MAFERRSLGGRAHALVSTTLERAGFAAAFSERGGGQSVTPFESLNVSYTVGDDPAAVAANRGLLIAGLSVPPFAVAGLVHGRRIGRIGAKRAGSGFVEASGVVPEVDGLVTGTLSCPIAVTWADCVPIVLASPAERRVACVHAGWRGIAAGIVSSAARAFLTPADVRVAVGPAIGPCHYEVGEDVALAVASASPAGAVTKRRRGKLYLDLVATVRAILREAGIRTVEDTGLCTACESKRFFSHRRDRVTGRHAAVAMRLS